MTGKFFFPSLTVANISGEIFWGALFDIQKCSWKPVPTPPPSFNLLMLLTPLREIVPMDNTNKVNK
jgi:hypothetical protein